MGPLKTPPSLTLTTDQPAGTTSSTTTKSTSAEGDTSRETRIVFSGTYPTPDPRWRKTKLSVEVVTPEPTKGARTPMITLWVSSKAAAPENWATPVVSAGIPTE